MPDAVIDTPRAPSVDAPPTPIMPPVEKVSSPSFEPLIAQNDEKEKNDALAELAATRDQLKTEVASDLSSEEKFGLGSRVDAKKWNATMAANEADGRFPVGQTPSEIVQKPVAPKSRWKTILPGVLAFLKLTAPKGMDTVATPQDIQQELLRPQPIVREMTSQQIDQLKQMPETPETMPQSGLESTPQNVNDSQSPAPESITPAQPTGGEVNLTPNSEPDIPAQKQPDEPVPDKGNPGEPEKPPSELIDMSQGERGTITVRPGDSGDRVPPEIGLQQNQLPSDPDTTPKLVVPSMPGTGGGEEAPNNMGMNPLTVAENLDVKVGPAEIAATIQQKGQDAGQVAVSALPSEPTPK